MIYYVIAKESGYLSEKPKGFLGILSDFSTKVLMDYGIQRQHRIDEFYVVHGTSPGGVLVNYSNDVYFVLNISEQGKLNIEILHDFEVLLSHLFRLIDKRLAEPFRMNSGVEKSIKDFELGYKPKVNSSGPVATIDWGFKRLQQDLLKQLNTAMASEIEVERKKYKFKLENN